MNADEERRWDRKRLMAVAVGGVAGGGARWAVVAAVESGRFPWPVLALNLVGSLLLGLLLAEEWTHPRLRLALHDAGAIGFCGGLTTFSAFSLEVVNLAKAGDPTLAALYAASSVVSAIGGVVAGAAALRRLRALALPLEAKP